ncbi:MAG: hypothetical protein WBM90_08700 [Acidimicrobiia bacterium]
MRGPHSASLAAGLIVAILGIVPAAVWAVGSQIGTPAPTTTTTIGRVSTLVEVAPPAIEEVDARLSRVLYAYGAAEAVEPGSSKYLPDEIIRVLAYYDVTLSVEQGDGQ